MADNNLLQETKRLSRLYNIKPDHSKGQNFLVDESVLERIIDTAKLKKSDTVLEVGPGLGLLTNRLIRQAGQVVSVELDKDLIKALQANFSGVKNLKLINNDILKVHRGKLGLPDDYKVVANIPYGITSRLLRLFLEQEPKPSELVMLLQKEVAERITAEPGAMSVLAVSVQIFSKPEIVSIVPANSFWPIPKVDSAIVKLLLHDKVLKVDQKQFFRVVKIGFSARRKKLKSNLAAGLRQPAEEVQKVFNKLKVDENARAQDLSVDNWLTLTTTMSKWLN